ncbi:lymphocyte cytosolic protein 2, isoform CRA_c [Rattus norvegicus]|uniref:Lymphocyte cytosolic protein 2 n=1 Tax=Rattus norvegicus TaxID=10116 RepID=A6HDH6_RAT|nr:lymphocyte cytosolic protein 2, isoform CRA_c [Rattus norvegicus]
MALKNVPFRSEVLAWNPDNLADYFRKLNYRDCEKAVKKYHIDGARFLNLTENDIQKFPKLRMPILSKLSQDINKNEERRSIFTRKPPVPRYPEEIEIHEEDDGGWSSFEDDYESPNDDDPDGEDDGDYESPNEEEETLVDDAADYEPPPSNDEEALQNSILPAKPFPNTNSMYIDRPPTGKVSQQPPVPPQRPMAALPPLPTGRNHSVSLFPFFQAALNRNHKTAKLPAPSIDRSTKPPLDRSLAPPLDREPLLGWYCSYFMHNNNGEHLPKIQKPPLPPAMDRHERNERIGPLTARKPPVPSWEGTLNVPDISSDYSFFFPSPLTVHQRPLPHPSLPSMSSNTFPSRSTKPSPKNTFPLPHMPGAISESASLPSYFSQGPSSRPPVRNEVRNLPLPVPNRPQPPSPGEEESPLDEEWYVSYITRPEAEAALRKINQDGTFLVRDSSKKTVNNPYVLMVLYKDKVYNIQIRYQEESQVYLLGTGLRGKEDFLSVSDIIDYFRKMPLLLIDGKNRGSRYQCTLTHAAGCL